MMSPHLDNWYSNGDKLMPSLSARFSFLSFHLPMNHCFEDIRDLPTCAPVNSALDNVVATLGLNNVDLETSVGELLSNPQGQNAALALTSKRSTTYYGRYILKFVSA
jgi:hypothetical protein